MDVPKLHQILIHSVWLFSLQVLVFPSNEQEKPWLSHRSKPSVVGVSPEVGADGGAAEVAASQSGRFRVELISLSRENRGENAGEIPVSYHLIVFCCGKHEVS